MVLLEACVDSVESALIAQQEGAQRIELCSSLLEGGITPSAGLITTVRARLQLPIHLMIRPRGGDFLYSDEEFAAMVGDVQMARQWGLDGVVFGVLNAQGGIDRPRMRQLVEAAGGIHTTCHRAFDMAADLFQAAQDLIEIGMDRILTSGGEPSALEGSATIRRLVEATAGRITIMAGGRINPDNVRAVLERSGVSEIHLGGSERIESGMRHRNTRVHMGSNGDGDYVRHILPAAKIRGVAHLTVANGRRSQTDLRPQSNGD